MSRVFSWLRGDVLAVSLVMHFLALALPLALLQVYDRILPSQSFGTATFLIVGVAIAIALEAILRHGRTALFADIGARYEADTPVQVFDHLLKADIAAVEKRGAASISDAIRGVSQVRDLWSGSAAAALYELPFVFVYIGLVAYIGGWLAIIPALLFAVAVGASLLLKRATELAAARVEHRDYTRRNLLWLLFAGLGEVKTMGAEGALTRTYATLNEDYMSASARLETRAAWVRENAALLGQLSTVLIVIFGALEVIAGHLTTGALAACTMLAGRSIGPAMSSLGYLSRLAQARDARAKLDELLALPAAPIQRDATGNGDARVTDGHLVLNVPTLSDRPVEVAPGTIALIDTDDLALGSHVLATIAGMSSIAGGEVRIDGHANTDFAPRDYRAAVALVTRHAALVPGSILNNLTLFDPRYNDAVADLADELGLTPYLNRLRNGILTEVGPTAAESIDEGMYQRIALIRAVVRKPRILLLDHAASGLDMDGDKRLAALLTRIRPHTTTVLATGKPALIALCTQRVVVRDRRRAQRGE